MLPPLRPSSYGMPIGAVQYYGAVDNNSTREHVRKTIVGRYGQDAYIGNIPSYVNHLYSEAQQGRFDKFGGQASSAKNAFNNNNQSQYNQLVLNVINKTYSRFFTVQLPQERAEIQSEMPALELDTESKKKMFTYLGIGGLSLVLLTGVLLVIVKVKKKKGKTTKKEV